MTPPQRLLAIETAGPELMVGLGALTEGGPSFRYRVGVDALHTQSALLLPAIQEGLTRLGCRLQDLNGVVVNVGPGSFTGLRTGLATVRTLGQFAALKLYALNHFEVLAQALSANSSEPVGFYLDARQGRAFHAVLRFDANGPVYEVEPALVTLREHGPPAQGIPVWCSASLMESFAGQSEVRPFPAPLPFLPDAMAHLVACYAERFLVSWDALLPLYLQAPNATLRQPRPGTFK
jgi:tRNA threonylcarbamoyl adenosine modification protein YeaZ